ncbi:MULTISPECIES: hypothetical protein [Nonomuraea]|uniref:Antibiotic biosynthesis monooxygenase n=1 Tax=Nonomuraea mangrovi TaxID=2316207 RepID=A0ABW4T4B8_9ACTN
MIARIWHGATSLDKSGDYLRLMREVAIPDYRSTPGNQGAYVLHHEDAEAAHFLTLTFWESERSIAAFAGDDVTVAKYYDFDSDYLLEKESRVTHYHLYDR